MKRYLLGLVGIVAAALITLGVVLAAEIGDLDTTDANNTARFPENQAPSTLNDGARALEGLTARWHRDWQGSVVAYGSADAVRVTANRTISSLTDGLQFAFEATATNTGATTLQIGSLAAKSLNKAHDQALSAGDLEAGLKVVVVYNADDDTFQMLTQTAGTAALGDMLGANNLSDVSSSTTAFTNIKVGSSTSVTGVVELATQAEAITGTDTGRVITPETLHGTLSGLGSATAATDDTIVFADTDDSDNMKEDTIQGILDLVPSGGGFTLGTEQSTGSGSSVTFGSIPSGTTMIVIMFEGVSFSTNVDMDVTIGDAGGLETSGYVSTGADGQTTAMEHTGSTAEFIVNGTGADRTYSGAMTLSLKDSANFTWAETHMLKANTTGTAWGAGHKSLSAELTQVSISGGTFDNGSINIMYQ